MKEDLQLSENKDEGKTNIVNIKEWVAAGGGGSMGGSWLSNLKPGTGILVKKKKSKIDLMELFVVMHSDHATRLQVENDQQAHRFWVDPKDFSDEHLLFEILYTEED